MKNNNWVFWLIGIGSMVFMSFVLWRNYLYATSLGKDYQGLFGDMFGASNALFTGLSFVGVIIAILLQRQELKLQRNELELTRNEMEQTRGEFITQNYTLKVQQFENTFFQMLNMYQDIVKNLSIFDFRHSILGKEVFGAKVKSFNSAANDYVRDELEIDYLMHNSDIEKFNIGLLNLSIKELLELYKGSAYNLKLSARTYFSIIFSLLKLLHSAEINDKDLYVSILKTQLSDEELMVIFYGCMVEDFDDQFIGLVKSFELLDSRSLDGIYNTSLADELKRLQSKTAS